MKLFRKIVFWCHLVAGVAAGVVILIMSVTGVLLTYEKQMTAWADARKHPVTPPAPGARPSLEAVLAAVGQAEEGRPTAVTFRAERTAPAQVSFGRERAVFADPYTGQVLGEGATGLRGFFRTVTSLHRWLAASGEMRPYGKAVTGACNLAFLFLVVSGFYLWWPRRWNMGAVRGVILFRRGLSGRARDFNWHNVIGFWCAVPLFVVVLSAVVISYPWASNLVYRLAGETPPARRGGPGGAGGPGRFGGREGGERRAHGSETRREGDRGGRAEAGAAQRPSSARGWAETETTAVVSGLDPLLARIEEQVSGWRTVSLQVPESAEAPLVFTVDQGSGGQPQKRIRFTVDRASGEVLKAETFADGSLGTRMRSILRFAHTGEVGGLAGQTLAGLVSAGGAFLVWTGLAPLARLARPPGASRRRRRRLRHFRELGS